MLFDPDNPRNTLVQIGVIFNIGIYIYFHLGQIILVLIFIPKKILMKYHDKISITSFWVCLKNEIFDHSFNICFSLIILNLAIIIVTMRDMNSLL